MDTAAVYRRFAFSEAEGHSPCYEQWANGVASCQRLVLLLDQLPPGKRQPNLLFGVARFLGIPAPAPFPTFRDWLIENWHNVREEILRRRTQTNEVGRCAVLLPVLALLSPPLALIEVGTSAGLCLYPDRFSYQYDDRPLVHPCQGPSSVFLPCTTTGPVPYPSSVPWVVWRAGIDLHPLDVTNNEEDRRWLEALIWPEQEARRDRLQNAIEIVRREPPDLVQGDLNQMVVTLVKQAPPKTTVVVFHSAVLAYVEDQGRRSFEELMQELSCYWISNESTDVIESVAKYLPHVAESRSRFVLALDGRPLAYTGPHGQSLDWF